MRKPVWRHIGRQSPKKATIKELRGEIKELEGDIKELQEEKVYQSEAGSCLVGNNCDSSDAAVWLLWGGRGWSLHSTTQFLCGGWGSRSWISGCVTPFIPPYPFPSCLPLLLLIYPYFPYLT